jgi:superfamily II DNA helicase RecQ
MLLEYIRNRPEDDIGIVYCMTRDHCEQAADYLMKNNVRQHHFLSLMRVVVIVIWCGCV